MAQTTVPKPKKKLQTFDKEQLAGLLSKKQQGQLGKMLSDRHLNRGRKRVAKWLAGFQIVLACLRVPSPRPRCVPLFATAVSTNSKIS